MTARPSGEAGAPTTIKAPTVQVGDLIDGRRVARVTGRKKRTTSNAIAHNPTSTRGLGSTATFSGHVVCIYFDDGGPPKYVFGNREIAVVRT